MSLFDWKMVRLLLKLVVLLAFANFLLCVSSKSVIENAQEYLKKAEQELKVNLKQLISAQWNQGSNITQENENKLVSIQNNTSNMYSFI